MTTRSSAMLRRSLDWVAFGLAVLAVAGGWWRDQPGGGATRTVIANAARICPGVSVKPRRPSVADGAHALDRAVLRRGLDALEIGQRRCRRGRAA